MNTNEQVKGSRWKKAMHELLSLKAPTDAVAWGFTIGTFVALTPTWGIHTLLIAILVALFKKNFTSAYISSWIFGNPLVAFPAYALEYRIGLFITGLAPVRLPERLMLSDLASFGWRVFVPAIVGCLLIAPLVALVVHLAFKKWLENRRSKLEAA